MRNKNLLLVLSLLIKFLAVGFGLIVNRWLNDYIPPESLKNYNLIIVYNSIILGVFSFGIPELIQKFYTNTSEAKEYADFWTTITFFRIIQYFLSIILIILTYPLSRTFDLFLIIGIFTSQYIILCDINFRSISDAFHRNWQFSLTDLGSKILIVFALYISLYFKIAQYLNVYIWASISIYLIQYFVDWYINRDYALLGRIKLDIIKNNFKGFLYLGLTAFVMGLYSSTDKWFLDYYGFNEFVINGYSNAFRLIEISLIVPSLMVPTICTLAKKSLIGDTLSKKNIFGKFDFNFKFLEKILPYRYRLILKYLLFSFFIGLLTFFSVLIVGYLGLILTVGKDSDYFNYAFESLLILTFALIPSGLITFFTMMNIFLDGEKLEFIGIVLIAVVVLGMYIAFIPNYGHIGASYASVLGNFFILIIKWIFMDISLNRFVKNRKVQYSK